MKLSPDDPELTAYALDELSAAERAAVEAALNADPECRRAVEAIRQTGSLLESALSLEPSPNLTPAQQRAILAAVPQPRPLWARWWPAAFSAWPAWKRGLAWAGAAAVLVVLFAVWLRPPVKQSPQAAGPTGAPSRLTGVPEPPPQDAAQSANRENRQGVSDAHTANPVQPPLAVTVEVNLPERPPASNRVRINIPERPPQVVSADPQAPAVTPNSQTQAPRSLELAALPLLLPAPTLKGTPQDLPMGPNIEKPSDKPRPPFMAPLGVKNVALGKKVTASDPRPFTGTYAQVTDGEKEAFDDQVVEMRRGTQWVQVDLGADYNLYAVLIWHDHRWLQVFHDVIVQLADDPDFTQNVRTLFNNDMDNTSGQGIGTNKEYFETNEGRLIDAQGIKARYLRCYSRGSSLSAINAVQEIEAYGLPAEGAAPQPAAPGNSDSPGGMQPPGGAAPAPLPLRLPVPVFR